MNPWTEGEARAGDGLKENGPPPGNAGKTVGKPPISAEAVSHALMDGGGYRRLISEFTSGVIMGRQLKSNWQIQLTCLTAEKLFIRPPEATGISFEAAVPLTKGGGGWVADRERWRR